MFSSHGKAHSRGSHVLADAARASRPLSGGPALGTIDHDPYPPATLPSPGTPLATIYDSLKIAADTGNYRAACRLGMEAMRCQWKHERLSAKKSVLSALSKLKPGSPDYADLEQSLANIEEGIRRDLTVCEGFSDLEKLTQEQYLLKAAQLGHMPSAEAYSIALPSLPTDFFNNVSAWMLYKENAGLMLSMAANAGSASAIEQLADEYMDDSFFSLLRLGIRRAPTDYVQAAVYTHAALLALPVGETPSNRQVVRLARLKEILTPGEQEQAKLAAMKLATNWSKDGTRPKTWKLPSDKDRDGDLICEK
jgi:hypothetical protein